MRLLAVYIPFLIVLLVVSGCGFSLGGADPPPPTVYHYKEILHHTSIEWHVHITVDDDSLQSKSINFFQMYPEYYNQLEGLYFGNFFNLSRDDSVHARDGFQNIYQGDAEYLNKYMNEYVEEKKRFETLPDSNGHIVFSLFDIDSVDKKYDIDASPFLKFLEHPYEMRGDSVDIFIPAGINSLSYGMCMGTYGYTTCDYTFEDDSDHILSTDVASVWSGWGTITVGSSLKNQSSLKTDNFYIELKYNLKY